MMPPGAGEPGSGPAGGPPPILGYRSPADPRDARTGVWKFGLYALGFAAVPFALVVAAVVCLVFDQQLGEAAQWATVVPPVGVLAGAAALSRRPGWRWVWHGVMGFGLAISVLVAVFVLVQAVAWLSRR